MSNSVVSLKEVEPGVALITMNDQANRNTFSDELISGLFGAFEEIETRNDLKAVVLTGYDSFFASGGTQDSLLAMQEGRMTFDQKSKGKNIYSMALDCPIPVIAAMQGHGIGGGFVLGLYADIAILSRESVYTTNFMRYGFTPGFGSTCILPEKLGLALAEEMLLSAANFRGAELEKRGVPFKVLPRSEVLAAALDQARDLAEKPRISLVTLKEHLVTPLREKLTAIIPLELKMHDKTFHQPEVKEKILSLFGK